MTYSIQIDDKLGMDASVKELEWTTTPPTVPGWYWIKFLEDQIYMANIENGATGLYVENIPGFDISFVISDFHITAWLGPLPIPPAPK